MRTKSLFALVGAALIVLSSATADDERIEAFANRFGERQLHVVRFIDRTWPGEKLLKVSEMEFIARLSETKLVGEGAPFSAAIETFLLYQQVALGAPEGDLRLRWTRPVPKNGSRPFRAPAAAYPDAALIEAEPNNGILQANPMTCMDTMDGDINPSGDDDFFVMSLGTASTVYATVNAGGATPITDPRLELLDVTGNRIAFNDDSNGLFPEIRIILPPGTYFWNVDGFSTRTGTYTFVPQCTPAVSINCATNVHNGVVAPLGVHGFILSVPEDTVSITASPAGGSQLQLEVFAQDGHTLIGESATGVLPGQGRVTTGFRAGTYAVLMTNLDPVNTEMFTFALICHGVPLTPLVCGAPPITTSPAADVWPAFPVGLSSFQNIILSGTDHGDPDECDIRLEDFRAIEIDTLNVNVGQSNSLNTFAGPGLMARLFTAPATSSAATWRDTTLAKSWCRETPTAAPYAGPTDLTVTSANVTFLNEHIDASGILRVRKHEIANFTTNGAWDVGIFIDECFIEVNAGAGPVRFAPSAIQFTFGNTVGWGTTYALGGPSEASANDGTHYAANLVDQSSAGQEPISIEIEFNVSSLGAPGSFIQSLRFYAEWYFAGNSSTAGTTQSPPTSDDSSEERDLVVHELQLKRNVAGTYDRLGDIAGGSTLTTPNPAVDVSLTCNPIVSGAMISAEDDVAGSITMGQAFVSHDYTLRSPASVTFETDNGAFPEWDLHPYAQSWSSPTPTSGVYPGPIQQASAGPFPPNLVGPGGVMRLRFRKTACWDATLDDNAHYFDVVRLSIDVGTGPVSYAPTTWVLRGFTPFTGTATGIYMSPLGIGDLAMNDGVYGRSRWDDYDTTSHPVQADYWDEFDFYVGSTVGQGGGNFIQNLTALLEVYMHGSGTATTPSTTESSEEAYMIAIDVELFDFAAGTWFDLSVAPIIDTTQYATRPNCGAASAALDPEIFVFDALTFELLGNNDDGGLGTNAKLTLGLGDPVLGFQQVKVVVGASDVALPGEETGPYAMRTIGSAGYAGTAPFQAALGSTAVFRMRGIDGNLGTLYHSVLPHLGAGFPLPPPFVGFVVVNPAGFRFSFPSGTFSGGVIETPVPIPTDIALLNVTLFCQGLEFDPGFTALTFSNEDQVTIVP